jgi:hypothetical protein
MEPQRSPAKLTFTRFYQHVFLPEHQHPATVAMHVLGTLASSALIVAVMAGSIAWWLALLFPVVHAAPGLIGHRLFERNSLIGDVRVTRRDYPPLWFIVGNHRMLWDLVTRGFHWRGKTE